MPAATGSPSRGLSPAIAGCFFFSGFSALVYQTAWTLELSFVFGSSEAAVATVLAVFLAGLGAGAAWAAPRVDRVARPLRLYAWIEAAIALSALAAPLLIRGVGALYVAAFGEQPDLVAAADGSRLLVMALASLVILGVPTALMGATLPLLGRHAVEHADQIGTRVGALYALNTLGAVLGTLSAGFWLLPAIGLSATQLVAAGVNALIAVVAATLARRFASSPRTSPGAAAEARSDGHRIVLVAMAISGFVTFSYEVLWFRLLRFLLAGSAQAFSIMLACFLLGIALGSAFAAPLARDSRAGRRGFIGAQLGVFATAWGAWLGLDAVPGLLDGTLSRSAGALLLLLPSTLCIGATFPFAVRWLARGAEDAGGAIARVYAWNTAGAVLGAAATGLWLLPAVGFAGVFAALLLASLLLCAAASLSGAGAGAAAAARSAPLAAVALGVSLLLVATPGPPSRLLRHDPLSGRVRPGPALFDAVGQTTTLGITPRGSRFDLVASGLTQSLVEGPHTAPKAHTVERWLGALGAYARPEARSLLLVGLGAGVGIEAIPGTIERIDVVELEPAMMDAARFLAPLRRDDPLADPRVRVVMNDARAALALTARRFDLVVSQPSRPWIAGSSQIYTREFAHAVRARLAPGGVFAQWMGLNFVDAERLGIVAATLLDAFEYVRVYRPGWRSGLVLLASDAPFDMSATAVAVIDADPDVALHLGITRPEDIEAALALDTEAVRRIAAGSRTNRDRHDRLGPATARLVRAAAAGTPYYEPPAVAVREITTDVRALARHGRTGALAQLAMTHPDAAERAFARALLAESRGQRDARDRELAAVLEAQPGHPGVTAGERAALERMRCDAHLARGEDRRALERLDIATRLDGGEPEDALRRARAAAALGDHAVATESLERVLSWLEGSLQAGQRSEALATLDAVLQALPPSAVEAAVQTRMDRLR